MKITLDRIANVTIVVTSIVVVAFIGHRLIAERTARTGRPLNQPYKIGDRVSEAFPVEFGSASQTVVLVLNTQCQYCTQSMPFYRSLKQVRSSLKSSTRLVVAGIEPVDKLASYLAKNGVEVDSVITIPGSRLQWKMTPAILVVNSSGQIGGFWPGFLTVEREDEVLQKIGAFRSAVAVR